MQLAGAGGPAEPNDLQKDDLWVFGYGSLMWRPGFSYVSRAQATVQGWRRRLCIYSHVYRGTADRPGLVLGLDKGGQCAGVAFRVAAGFREPTLEYLRDRELITPVYHEVYVSTKLQSGIEVEALTYVADTDHAQYAPPMDRPRLLELVRQGVGCSGENIEYVLNTHNHLEEMGIQDGELDWLASELRGI
jgi:glutathione-specific gamma-glutamylcyclotransferase